MKRQVIKNIATNFISFIVNTGMIIVLTPYLVGELGIEAYGYIPLSMLFVTYVNVIIDSICASINRYVINAIGVRGDDDVAIIFNTFFFMVLSISGVISILAFVLFFWLGDIINIPDELLNDVKLLFIYVILSFAVSILGSVYSVALFSNNRIDLMQIINLLKLIIRAVMIVALFVYDGVSLSNVGIATFIASIFSLILYIVFFKFYFPCFTFKFGNVNFKKVKPIMNTSFWVLVNQFGSIILTRLDLLLVNKLVDAKMMGVYAIFIKFNDILKSMSSIVGTAIAPYINKLHAKNAEVELLESNVLFIKLTGVILSIPIGMLCVYSEFIIGRWVGYEFTYVSQYIPFIVIPSLINLSITPLFSTQLALNKVKFSAVLNVVFGITSIVICIILTKKYDMGIYGILIGTQGCLLFKNLIIIPTYTAIILNKNILYFTRPLVTSSLSFVISYASFLLLDNYTYFDDWWCFFSWIVPTSMAILILLAVTMFFDDWKLYLLNKESVRDY